MSFKSYIKEKIKEQETILEAAFNIKDLERVSELLAKIASKKLGAQFQFAWIEKFKKDNGRQGLGYRYMSPQGLQIRFNNYSKSKSSYTLGGVDFWDKGDGLTEPSLTLTWQDDINIVKLKEQLFQAIKTKKAPVVTAQDVYENVNEARGDRSKRKGFAKEHGIPSSYANSNVGMRKKIEELGLQAEYDDWMQIDSNVGEITDFSQKADADQKKLVSNSREFYADPKFVFEDMKQAAMTVAKGKWRSLIIAGMGGIGKTYGVKQVLTQELGPYGEGPDGKWAFYEGLKTTGFGLYKLLLLNRNKLVVFDDSDSIWNDKDMINMMKIVTSDSGDRKISWSSGAVAQTALMTKEEREEYEEEYIMNLMEDPNTKIKAPSSFNFTGSMINISNLPANKFDNAIKSRAIFIDLYLAERDVIRRMYSIKQMQGKDDKIIRMLLKALVPDAEDALEGKGRYAGEVHYMTPEEARKHKTLNMRSLDIAEALYESGVKDWERMAGLYA